MTQNNPWDKHPDESAEHYGYFREFLLMKPVRRIETLSQILQKSSVHLRSLARKYDWRDRAAQYDSSLMEAARETIRRQLPKVLEQQWSSCVKIAAAAAAELLKRDLSKASFKSLNEIIANTHSQQHKIEEILDVLGDNDDKGEMVIRIVNAGDQTENQ